jgi:hypothetical protein
MAVSCSLTEAQANDLLEARYNSTEIPFKHTAQMITTLSAVYHNNNQDSKACEELRKLEYYPADKKMDIHQFIGTVNSLANKAGLLKAERKAVLLEHIPTDLDFHLLLDSKDMTISYDDFAGAVIDVAVSKQRAYEKRTLTKQALHNQSPTGQPIRSARHHSPYHKDPNEAKSTFASTFPVSERKKVKQKIDDKCFLY